MNKRNNLVTSKLQEESTSTMKYSDNLMIR